MKTARCSATVYEPRVSHHQCTRRGVIERDGKWYCRQHDPEAEKARRDARDKESSDREREGRRNEKDMKALAARLGCGCPHYHVGLVSFKDSGYRRALLLTEAEVLGLLARLEGRQELDGVELNGGTNAWDLLQRSTFIS